MTSHIATCPFLVYASGDSCKADKNMHGFLLSPRPGSNNIELICGHFPPILSSTINRAGSSIGTRQRPEVLHVVFRNPHFVFASSAQMRVRLEGFKEETCPLRRIRNRIQKFARASSKVSNLEFQWEKVSYSSKSSRSRLRSQAGAHLSLEDVCLLQPQY